MADSWRIRHDFENRLDADQLAALAAVVEFGSFDVAAQRLHVTPSAVSQRIKALEQRVGACVRAEARIGRAYLTVEGVRSGHVGCVAVAGGVSDVEGALA
jgi:molybdenum-dependent DNA-binding transcriptional regulator ModE